MTACGRYRRVPGFAEDARSFLDQALRWGVGVYVVGSICTVDAEPTACITRRCQML
jgi:hypothetical protein